MSSEREEIAEDDIVQILFSVQRGALPLRPAAVQIMELYEAAARRPDPVPAALVEALALAAAKALRPHLFPSTGADLSTAQHQRSAVEQVKPAIAAALAQASKDGEA